MSDDELDYAERLMSQLENAPYIGDAAFRSFLRKYGSAEDLALFRMRFLGAAIYTGRQTDTFIVAEELFENGIPALDGPELIEFLRILLGLFNEMSRVAEGSDAALSPIGAVKSIKNVEGLLLRRVDEITFGFLEGVWQGSSELALSPVQAALLTEIEETTRGYEDIFAVVLAAKSSNPALPVATLVGEIGEIDEKLERSIASLAKAFRTDDPATHPLMTRAEQLVESLAMATDLPRDAIRECLDRRQEMGPVFLKLLQDQGRLHLDGVESALFFAIHILGEIGETRAFEPLIDFLAGDQEWVETVLSDATTETLPKILISVFDGDVGHFYRLIDDAKIDQFVRSTALEAWTYHAAMGHIDRPEVERYLASLPGTLEAQPDNYIWIAWQNAIALLGVSDLNGAVKKAYDSGSISEVMMRYSEFEKLAKSAALAEDPAALLATEGMAPFTDTIATLSHWHWRPEDEPPADWLAARDYPLSIDPGLTVINPNRNIGRNDPCPCGSGKKYKKCCLQ